MSSDSQSISSENSSIVDYNRKSKAASQKSKEELKIFDNVSDEKVVRNDQNREFVED